MNKLSIIGSCQLVAMINSSAIESHVKSQSGVLLSFKTFRLFQNTHRKTIRLLTDHLHFSSIPKLKYALSCLINSFESRPLLLRAVRLRGPSFHKIYPSILKRHVIMIIEDSS